MIFHQTKTDLRHEIRELRDHAARTAMENVNLRRQLQLALTRLGSAEQFLAVLVGEQLPDGDR